MDVSQNASTYIKMPDQWPSKRPQLTGQPPRPPMAIPVHQAFLHFPSVLRSENHHLPGSKVQRHRGAGAHAFSGPVARESACVVNRIVLSQSHPPAMPGHSHVLWTLMDPGLLGSPGVHQGSALIATHTKCESVIYLWGNYIITCRQVAPEAH